MNFTSSTIETIFNNFRPLPGYQEGHQDMTELSAESGYNLLKVLAVFEERDK